MTLTEQRLAAHKVERAIDMLVAVQDLGCGADAVERALELLRGALCRLEDSIAQNGHGGRA